MNENQMPDPEPVHDPGAPGHDPDTCNDCGIQHDRAQYIVSECREGRWLPLMRAPYDDDLMDCLAGVRAVREDDVPGLAVILRNGAHTRMTVTLLKLVAEMCDDESIDPSWFAVFASHAIQRG